MISPNSTTINGQTSMLYMPQPLATARRTLQAGMLITLALGLNFVSYTQHETKEIGYSTPNYVPLDNPHASKLATTASPSDMLTDIRQILPLTITDLAAMLEVTRPTVYAYLEGQQNPQQGTLRRLTTLTKQVQSLKSLGPDLKHLVRYPLFEKQNLLQRLRAGSLPDNALTLLRTALTERQAQRKSLNEALSDRKPVLSAYIDEFSVPLYDKA